jgi:S1-C subfamily serine protease
VARHYLLVKVNDETVRDIEAFTRGIANHKPGDKIQVGIVRDGKEQTLTATLGERPAQEGPAFPEIRGQGRPAFLGVQAQPLTPELKEQVHAQADKGVVVMEVVPNSRAPKAGLKRDDVITAVDDLQIKALGDLFTAVQKAGSDKPITFHLMRGKENLSFKAALREGSFGRFLTPSAERFPSLDVESMIDQGRRIRELEHRVAELEKRIRELEKK